MIDSTSGSQPANSRASAAGSPGADHDSPISASVGTAARNVSSAPERTGYVTKCLPGPIQTRTVPAGHDTLAAGISPRYPTDPDGTAARDSSPYSRKTE